MLPDDFVRVIATPDFDLASFARLAVDDEQARAEMLRQMIDNSDIMVYYHCFYVLDRASQEHPELFLPAWEALIALLDHPNSYHRDFGLTLIANLARGDTTGRFERLFDAYFARLHDEKFMTGRCCLVNGIKIMRCQPALGARILERLLAMDQGSPYSDKQRALLHGDVIDALEWAATRFEGKDETMRRMRAELDSPSPTTRRKARAAIGRITDC